MKFTSSPKFLLAQVPAPHLQEPDISSRRGGPLSAAREVLVLEAWGSAPPHGPRHPPSLQKRGRPRGSAGAPYSTAEGPVASTVAHFLRSRVPAWGHGEESGRRKQANYGGRLSLPRYYGFISPRGCRGARNSWLVVLGGVLPHSASRSPPLSFGLCPGLLPKLCLCALSSTMRGHGS